MNDESHRQRTGRNEAPKRAKRPSLARDHRHETRACNGRHETRACSDRRETRAYYDHQEIANRAPLEIVNLATANEMRVATREAEMPASRRIAVPGTKVFIAKNETRACTEVEPVTRQRAHNE